MFENSIILEWMNRKFTIMDNGSQTPTATIEEFDAALNGYNPVHERLYNAIERGYDPKTIAALEQAADQAAEHIPISECKRTLTPAETDTLIQAMQQTFEVPTIPSEVPARFRATMYVNGEVPTFDIPVLSSAGSNGETSSSYTANTNPPQPDEEIGFAGELIPPLIPFAPVPEAWRTPGQKLEEIHCR
jgi:hypothetical protein